MKLVDFDLIGGTPKLFIDNSKKHKSKMGAIFSIIIAILSMLCFAGFGLDLFQKKRPELFNSREFSYDTSIAGNQIVMAFCPLLAGF